MEQTQLLVLDECCAPIRAEAVTAEAAETLASAFRALGDPVRLRLLSLVASADGGRVCACDLIDPVGKSQPTVSHHLKVLREVGLVRAEKRGTNVWYSIVPEQLDALVAALGRG